MGLRAAELVERRRFDHRVVSGMRGPLFDFQAYRTSADLQDSRDPVTRAEDAGEVSKYQMTLRVPTLIGAGEFRPETVFGVDLDVRDYPLTEPLTWVVSDPVPWSPHFQKGSPICIGAEFWTARKGHVTLGDLVIHIARLLNWDEKGRGGGYVGWNPEAIDHHAEHYRGRPLDPELQYPALPTWLLGAPAEPISAFEIVEHRRLDG
ncbi:hypothetical protein [Herbidospora mongoliensis]|uniref:hypothetical protein n=1 Tax=Herbidospora mongoliensis TaxID=688067 RepID=UPI00082F361F|nr:hypothetical protein [Herbidospora mongoliensis]